MHRMDRTLISLTFLMTVLWVVESNKFREIDDKTKEEVMKLGKQIFGGQSLQQKSLDTSSGTVPDPADTWKLWQKVDRRNTLERLQKQKNKKNKNRRKVPIFLYGKHYQAKLASEDAAVNDFGVKVPKLLFGFSMLTKSNIPLESKETMEIHDYEISKDGTFERGGLTNQRLGRFEAPIAGVYQFHAIVHVALPRHIKELQRKDFVVVSLCIDGECRKKMTISSISGLENNSRIFSVNLSGFLHLKGKQRASIFVVNKSPRYDISILKGSFFSGVLMGV